MANPQKDLDGKNNRKFWDNIGMKPVKPFHINKLGNFYIEKSIFSLYSAGFLMVLQRR